jgi:protein SCO1/2
MVLAASYSQVCAITPAEYDNIGVQLPQGATLPVGIKLLDESGRVVSLDDWTTLPAVLVLSDYTCQTLCSPILSLVASSLQASNLVGGQDFKLIVVGLDPKDGVAAAREARTKEIGAELPASALLVATADDSSLRSLTQALGYRYAYDAGTDQFVHPGAVFVLRRGGGVSRVMAGLGLGPSDLRLALVEASAGTVGTLSDRVRLICSSFDPAHGIYNVAISRVLIVVGLLTCVLLGGLILALALGGRRGAT